MADPDRLEHAHRLAEAHERRMLAAGLERAVADAEHPASQAVGASVPVQRAEVRAARPALLRLAERLRADGDVRHDGVELVRRLLSDGGAPLYRPAPPGTLLHAVDEALVALGDDGPDRP